MEIIVCVVSKIFVLDEFQGSNFSACKMNIIFTLFTTCMLYLKGSKHAKVI